MSMSTLGNSVNQTALCACVWCKTLVTGERPLPANFGCDFDHQIYAGYRMWVRLGFPRTEPWIDPFTKKLTLFYGALCKRVAAYYAAQDADTLWAMGDYQAAAQTDRVLAEAG